MVRNERLMKKYIFRTFLDKLLRAYSTPGLGFGNRNKDNEYRKGTMLALLDGLWHVRFPSASDSEPADDGS